MINSPSIIYGLSATVHFVSLDITLLENSLSLIISAQNADVAFPIIPLVSPLVDI